MRSIETKRYFADFLSIAPFVLLGVAAMAFESSAFLWVMAVYALYLFKWTWGLGYVWADMVMYGAMLESKLGRFKPPGDPGTLRFPASLWHCLVRVGAIPALLAGLVVIVGAFVPRPAGNASQSPAVPVPTASAPAAPAPPTEPESSDPRERVKARGRREIAAARAYLQSAKDIAVPVDPETRTLKKDEFVNRTDMSFFTVYANPSGLPPNTAYQLMTGPQLLDTFLKTEGHDIDLLTIRGPNLPLSRWQAAKIAPDMPASEPPNSKVMRSHKE